ncbi:MAG: AraC family transcriptional regulator [Leptolyngbyaceae cyanobacterium SL_5_9]|nr:AraC family transcriptional regulator [Leptolyngbyaceae cyanobacterium SL_5_9]NJO74968.1 AraC family transcriptional regulator [Leptolyngbyaceae cyanobacterium RM1_406_9]
MQTKFWVLSELDGLELFRATAIRYSYARHSHASYSIGLIEAGVGGNYYRGSTYLAPPGSIILMNPEEAHTGYSAEEQPLSYRMLYANINVVQQIARDLQIQDFPHFKDAVVQDRTLAKHLLSLHQELERSPNQLEHQSRFVNVLSKVLTHYADVKVPSFRPQKEHRAVQLVKTYLQDRFSSNISLEQLTNITGLNRSYLIRVFCQSVGMPPYTYLNQVRVEKAKQLLAQRLAVAEVAIAVGMSDQSHLTRHFKRIVGITPGQYRQMSTSFKTD